MSSTSLPVESIAAGGSGWPEARGRRIVFVLEVASSIERRILEGWIEEHEPSESEPVETVTIPATRRGGRHSLDPRLEQRLSVDDDPLLAPLRVVWFPPDRAGETVLRRRDLLFGDPRDPGRLRQRWILHRTPERQRVVHGEPAPVSELRRRWRSSSGGDTTGLAEFVARQAALALERAERQLRGARYKVPRFVSEDILSRAAFRGGLSRIARALERTESSVYREAAGGLREIAATHSPYVIDVVAHLIRGLYTLGYDEALDYDRDELEEIYALAQRHTVVFLPSHKSNLDHLVLQYALHESGHPPNHTAAGINMNFFPIGPLIRRSGSFFIRRSFKDDEVYKFVLQNYLDYLVEKRFPLEWYIEGGRSRSGKLLPPRFGLLAYVVDAYRRGKSDDVVIIPTAIAYDQIQDVGDYAAEQRGGAKERESFTWFLKVIRRLRRRYGRIHLRFGDPISLRESIGEPTPTAEPSADEKSLDVQKLAFEVAVRINTVTPITESSLVAMSLLGWGDRALALRQITGSVKRLLAYARVRNLPTTGELDLDDEAGVRKSLRHLVENDLVSCFDEGPEEVYAIGPDQHLSAAYYRNSVIHFFVSPAIMELALLRAAEVDVTNPTDAFWETVLGLRDLLKFEFFFKEKDAFLAEVRTELSIQDPDWENRLSRGGEEIVQMVRRFRPFHSQRVLRPFLEAYQVVGDSLDAHAPDEPVETDVFLGSCMALGRQYLLQRRLRNAESLSRVLFETALNLARNRNLVDLGGERLKERRKEWAEEIRGAIRRVDAIDALAAARLAGVGD